MPQVIVSHELPFSSYRYDIISGQRQGPFVLWTSLWKRRRRETWPVKTENWSYYVRTGAWKPTNSYNLRLTREDQPTGFPYCTLTWLPNGDQSIYYGVVSSDFGGTTYLELSDADRVSLFNYLDRRCLEKIKGQKLNLGVFAAERGQTANLFADTARRIANAVGHVRRKQFREAFRDLGCRESNKLNAKKTTAQNWLALQYGWKPLLSDAYGAAEELEKSFEPLVDKPPIVMVRAKGGRDGEDVLYPSSFFGAKVSRGFVATGRVVVAYYVDTESSQWLGRLGLTNPLDIAWEKLPWSFVVDWFIPIGKFINTLDATIGCTPISTTSSLAQTSIIQWTQKDERLTYGGSMKEERNSVGHGKQVRYDRSGSTGTFPSVHLPQVKNPYSGLHLANAMALLTQAFSKK